MEKVPVTTYNPTRILIIIIYKTQMIIKFPNDFK